MRYAALAVLTLFLSKHCFAQCASTKSLDSPPIGTSLADLIDPTLDPCSNFQAYVCHRWFVSHPLTPGVSMSGIASRLFEGEGILRHRLIEEAELAPRSTPANKLISMYVSACKQAQKPKEKIGPKAKEELRKIDGISNGRQLAREIARVQLSTPGGWSDASSPFFTISFSDSVEVMPRGVATIEVTGHSFIREASAQTGVGNSELDKQHYNRSIEAMFVLAGESSARAKADAEWSTVLEEALAAFRKNSSGANGHDSLRDLTYVKKSVPGFDWKLYLNSLGAGHVRVLKVNSQINLAQLSNLISHSPMPEMRAYLRLHFLLLASKGLGPGFARAAAIAAEAKNNETEDSQPPAVDCYAAASDDMPDAIAEAYVGEKFSLEDRAKAMSIVVAIQNALLRAVDHASWMGEETKSEARSKVKAMILNVGYPESWHINQLRLDKKDYLVDLRRIAAFQLASNTNSKEFENDRKEWRVPPDTMNAFEDPVANVLTVPAGILQYPFFASKATDSENMGSIGVIIGHEMTHGLDSEGETVDSHGRARDWWTDADKQRYTEASGCYVRQYAEEIPGLGRPDSKLTLNEDVADNGGLALALSALTETLPGHEQDLQVVGPDGLSNLQRFFVAFGSTGCTEVSAEASRYLLAHSVHALPMIRVNNAVSNMPAFRSAFGCSAKAPMVKPDPCVIW
jgi:putative endopeptidase